MALSRYRNGEALRGGVSVTHRCVEKVWYRDSLGRVVVLRPPNTERPGQNDENGQNDEENCYKIYTITFRGFGKLCTSNTPKFIRVNHRHIDCEKIWRTFKAQCGDQCPKLILSIDGGAKRMKPLTRKLQTAVKRGLIRMCDTAKTCLITSGLNVGVSKIVGNAMRKYSLGLTGRDPPFLIGIATWGSVCNRPQLRETDETSLYYNCQSPGKGQAMLEPHHTHFILFDDGTKMQYNREMKFRNELERKFKEKISPPGNLCSAPMVQVVIEGGKTTIETIFSCSEEKIPTVLIKGSGRCADLICELWEKTDEELERVGEIIDEILKKYKESLGITDTEESHYREQLLEMFQDMDRRRQLYIFDVDDSNKELDYVILHAALENKASSSNHVEQLSLVMEMNRCDLAKTVLSKGDWKDKDKHVNKQLMDALKKRQTDFVNLFFNRGTCIEQFLSKDKLLELYLHTDPNARGCETLKISHKDGDMDLFTIGRNINAMTGDVIRNPYEYTERITKAGRTTAKDKGKTWKEDRTTYPPRSSEGHRLYTEQDLFFWALQKNEMDLVKIFWRFGKDHIGAALFAYGIFRHRRRKAASACKLFLAKSYEENSAYFEKMAYDILSKAYERDEKLAYKLLFRGLPYFGNETVLSLANQNECLEFMTHPAVQSKLNHIWHGDRDHEDCTLKDETKNANRDTNSRRMDPSKIVHFIREKYRRLNAPLVKFILNTVSNVLLLLLVCYVTMIELKPHPSSSVAPSNNTAKKTCSGVSMLQMCVSPFEFLLWFWIFTLAMEELRQIHSYEQQSLRYKLKDWWSNGWNRLDFLIYFSFAVAIILRFSLPQKYFQYNRYAYVFVMVIFFMRFTQSYYVSRALGPKVVMISKMIGDIAFFLIISIIFLLAYGTAAQALLYPNSKLDWNLLKKILHHPYFQMYGELNLKEPEGLNPGARQEGLVVVLFAVYLLLTNILMLSLLAAMFGYTFENVQMKSYNIWAHKRYDLIFEYRYRPFLPPPLIIFPIIFRSVRHLCRRCGWLSSNESLSKSKNVLPRIENRKMSAFEQQCMELVLTDMDREKKKHLIEIMKLERLLELDARREAENPEYI